MIVCICHRISDRDIARAAGQGCATFEELQFELAVATGCGCCHDCARQTFERHAPAQPASAAEFGGGRAAPQTQLGSSVVVVHGRRVQQAVPA